MVDTEVASALIGYLRISRSRVRHNERMAFCICFREPGESWLGTSDGFPSGDVHRLLLACPCRSSYSRPIRGVGSIGGRGEDATHPPLRCNERAKKRKDPRGQAAARMVAHNRRAHCEGWWMAARDRLELHDPWLEILTAQKVGRC